MNSEKPKNSQLQQLTEENSERLPMSLSRHSERGTTDRKPKYRLCKLNEQQLTNANRLLQKHQDD